MNSILVISCMTLSLAYIFMVNDCSYYLSSTTIDIKKSTERFYILEGLLAYGVAYYKQHQNKLFIGSDVENKVISCAALINNKKAQLVFKKNENSVTIEVYTSTQRVISDAMCVLNTESSSYSIKQWIINV